MAAYTESRPDFLEAVVDFPGHGTYEIINQLTDFRSCHYGTPQEARIVFTCRQIKLESGLESSEDEFVMKVKVQEPSSSKSVPPEQGPSSTTKSEIEALDRLSKLNNLSTPKLIAWKTDIQGATAPLPGGYLTYVIMSKLPGRALFDLGYQRSLMEDGADVVKEREIIKVQALEALRPIYAAGIKPGDCGLRNILWDQQTQKCYIIDFELWQETTEMFKDEAYVLQRWGVIPRPPPKDWFEAWARRDE